MKAKYLLAAALLAVTGCAGDNDTSSDDKKADESSTNVGEQGAAALPSGLLPPGRYRHVVPSLGMDVTVPDGWRGAPEYHTIESVTESNSGPTGAALVLGWTTDTVGLLSDPCIHGEEVLPDIKVGPTVDDFVDAIQAQKGLVLTKPKDVELDGYSGRYFTLRGPADISKCDYWQPWEPSFYAQGENNLWEVWVMDVQGFRTLIVTEHFPDTPPSVTTQLRQMAESVEFEPNL